MTEAADREAEREEMSAEQMSAVLDHYGQYQRRLFILISFILIMGGYRTMSVVLTFASPPHRCQVPGLANDTFSIQNEVHRMLVNLSIPMTSSDGDVSYSKCDVYKDRGAEHVNDTLYDDTEPCDRWVYDDTDFEKTIVTQFDLVCDKKGFRANFNMMYLLGMLVGSPLSGYLCDRWGRKRLAMVFLTLGITLAIAAAFPVVTAMLLVYRFLLAVCGMGVYLSLYVLSLEFMGTAHRTVAGSLMMVLWVLGCFLVGFLSYGVRDWRWLQVLNGAPFILCLSYWWLLDESPRWLLNKGRKQEAQKVIMKVMKVNKIKMSADGCLLREDGLQLEDITERQTLPVDNIDTSTDKEGRNGEAVEGDHEMLTDSPRGVDSSKDHGDGEGAGGKKDAEAGQESALQLFRYPNLLARSGIILFNWAAITTTYHGLSLNVGNLGGNIRANFLLSSTVEVVGYSAAWFLLDRLGRKRTHCAAMLLSGTSCLATIFSVLFGGAELHWVTILLVMVGKLGISAAASTVYLMSGELYPTVIRNRAIGCSSAMGGFANILSPHISDLSLHMEGSVGRALPLVIFGALALTAGLLALCLPETLHRKLPDTILEAANFTRQGRVNTDRQQGKDRGGTTEARTEEGKYTGVSTQEL